MPKWNVTIPDETDHLVRVFLSRTGMKKGDLSAFVDDAVQGEVLRRLVQELKSKDAGVGDDDAVALAENLVALERGMEDVRSGNGQPLKAAIRQIAGELGLKLLRR